MRRHFVALACVLLGIGTGCQATLPSRTPTAAPAPPWSVCFSPRGGCTELIVNTIGQAHSRVLVQAYSFTSEPIAQALVAAHKRGVQVEAVLDKSQKTEDDSRAKLLVEAGIPVKIDAAHAIAHNKILVIDSGVVMTGSFNFTKGAEERNAENLLVVKDRALAAKYEENWKQHEAHSRPYVP